MSEARPLSPEIERLRSAVNELTILNELALAASSSTDVDRVLDIIVEKARKAVNAEQGSIMLVTSSPDMPLQTLIRQADHSQIMAGYKVGIPISGWVLKYRQPLLIEDLGSDDRFKVSPEEARQIRTVLCVPIMFKSELLGVLIMANKKSGVSFSKDDLRLLTIMAAQSGQLIRNSQMQVEIIEKKRLESELDLARQIQQKLLPAGPPEFDGIDVASYFRPHESVSGDYYDFFLLSAERIGVIAADVSGHGPPAALVMTLVKGIAHTVISASVSPSEALTGINRICSRIIPPDMFVTMIYCIIDTGKKLVTLANAGHNPLLWFDHNADGYQLEEATGCAINLLPEVEYQEISLNAASDDILLLYTDGLTEATNSSQEMLGLDTVGRLVRENASSDAGSLITKLRDALIMHEDKTPPADDVLMIAIKFP